MYIFVLLLVNTYYKITIVNRNNYLYHKHYTIVVPTHYVLPTSIELLVNITMTISTMIILKIM